MFTSTYPYFTDPILAVYGAALRKGGSRDKSDDYIVQPVVVEYQEQAAEVIVSVASALRGSGLRAGMGAG